MQHHTAQLLSAGPRQGKWIYSKGNADTRHAECCAEAWLEMLQTPAEQRDAAPAWEHIGHDTAEQAYAHMRQFLLEKLRLDTHFTDWSGCRAPTAGGRCDTPTKSGADIPPAHFTEPLCDEHRTRATVEAMWDGPGDWSGSW
jgi:hypothetical protein